MKHLDDPIANALFISIIELMEYFCLESERADQNHLFDEISQSLNQNKREDALFNCLAIPDDGVRLAVVRCLYVVPLDEFDSEEIERITSIVTMCNNICAGETELILSTIYWICTKFVTPNADDSASTSSTIFINKFGEQTINEALNILAKNLERVAEKKDDKQKYALSLSILNFLKAATETPTASQADSGAFERYPMRKYFRGRTQIFKQILTREDEYSS